jgi:DNA-binding beta-propeller fold protein YncE
VNTFPVGGTAAAVDPETNTLYLVRPGHDVGVLEVVDATTGDVVTSIKSGVWPTDVEVDPKGIGYT